ncbi:LysR family transcriptional regulator substrate-binding protein [Kocuria sp. cx-455]|uniref:LysR family transcriptional regulator substrate-binding protein n=1 Tax=Kocuria sp. cx-455 TaxID=2771377 RepID=UPI003D72EFA5
MTEPQLPETAQPSEHQPVRDRFAIGYVPGVMPGKWFRRWEDRRHTPVLHQYLVRADGWREALTSGEIKACFVRLNWEDQDPSVEELREEFRAVALYEELQVAVLDRDHILTVAETLTTGELTAESEPQARPRTDDADMAVELTAAGVGPVILPMSVARLHHRKDVTYRELTDAPTVPVMLVWPRDLTEADEAAVQQLVGIVRGRSANSGRDTPARAEEERKNKKQPPKQHPKAAQRRGGRGPKGAKAASVSKNARRRRPR